jgi:crotonobetainyl-CoA:carnitine CoA-transferase CaiB-like acyl-CoA transferase
MGALILLPRAVPAAAVGVNLGNKMAGPLSHIKVLDLSRIMAGPWASQVLADLGADVIKVERPGAGDDTRAWGPPFHKGADGKETREAGYFLSVNRGKRPITVALDQPEGRKIIQALAAKSDILLENYKVGTLKKFGLDYESLKVENERLIYCSVTGFGQDGPRKDQAAYDFLIVDLMTGMYAAVGMLAALARREQTGQGEYIDLAMLDVQLGFLSNQALNHLVSGKVPQRAGNAHPNIQPQDVFPCRDGQVVIVVGNDGQFAKFCEALQKPKWVKDERFATNPARVKNLAVLNPMILEELMKHDRAHWVEALEAVGVPCGPINSIPEAFADPQAVHRGLRIDLPHPSGKPVPQVKNPLRFANAPLKPERAPPLLGQHTAEVLAELGFSVAEIDAMKKTGAI